MGGKSYFSFTVTPDKGESFDVYTDSKDVRLWERISPRNTLRKLAENPSFDDYYSLIHIAIKRQQLMTDVPSLSDFIDTHVVMPKQDTTVEALNRDELVEVIDKAMCHPEYTAEFISDTVMDFLESLPGRSPDPTRPAR